MMLPVPPLSLQSSFVVAFIIVKCFWTISLVESFSTIPTFPSTPVFPRHISPFYMTSKSESVGHELPFDSSETLTRRSALSQSSNAALFCFGLNLLSKTSAYADGNLPSNAINNAAGLGESPDHPIVVLGAGGKVGQICTRILAEKNLYTRAVTRSGRTVLPSSSSFVSYAAGDVTDSNSVASALNGASGVIFAASASGKQKGGDPAHVDYLGVYNVARACLQNQVPKLAVVSAATVTRPESAGFIATNFFVKFVYGEKIMDYKGAGEAILRDLYNQNNNNKVAYTILRPGGLKDESSVGPTQLHVSQGDVYASEISREDVALLTVAALLAGPATDFTTMEISEIKNINKTQKNLPDSPPELVHAGAPTFNELLQGLLTDQNLRAKYPDIVSDFRGNKIVPVEQLTSTTAK